MSRLRDAFLALFDPERRAERRYRRICHAQRLHGVADRGELERVCLLLKEGVRVDQRDLDGFTPLMRAVEDNYVEAARLLLEHGANVNARATEGEFTVLMIACKRGFGHNFPAISLLLDHGADIHAGDWIKRTALNLAAHSGHTEIV